MKVVIAIDSFKGSLSSIEAAKAVEKGILLVHPDAEIIIKPLADGGEGTVDSLVSGMGGDIVDCEVTGPQGKPVQARYGIISNGNLAVIEMATSSGITLVPPSERNPMNTTTYGVGEMVRHALDSGCRDFIVGIGGSATNDCGIGMLEALGVKFLDGEGVVVGPYGRDLLRIVDVDISGLDVRIAESNFKIACDVDNPLCGKRGATAVYGPQKGANDEMVAILDRGLFSLANVIKSKYKIDNINYPGAGAAGGLGYAFKTFLNGKLESGISIILKEIKLEEELMNADVAVTGEGKLDFQTAMGKAPIGVAKLAKKFGCKVIAFAGCADEDARECNFNGIDAFFPILRTPCSLSEAMDTGNSAKNMELTAEQVFRLIN